MDDNSFHHIWCDTSRKTFLYYLHACNCEKEHRLIFQLDGIEVHAVVVYAGSCPLPPVKLNDTELAIPFLTNESNDQIRARIQKANESQKTDQTRNNHP